MRPHGTAPPPSPRLVSLLTRDEHERLAGVHYRAHADRQRHLGHGCKHARGGQPSGAALAAAGWQAAEWQRIGCAVTSAPPARPTPNDAPLMSLPKKRELARIVSYASVLMRVRDVSDDPGSSAQRSEGRA